MENFEKNKIIGVVFTNYLKKKLGKQYEVTEPKKKYVPDVDLVLTYKQEELFLQLKQVIKWSETFKDTPPGTKGWIFDGCLFKEEIQKAESTYLKRDNDISDRILILHSGGFDYYYPGDELSVDRNEFISSNFKGIYIVSPKEDIWGGSGAEPQDEFVYEIKPAFLSSPVK